MSDPTASDNTPEAKPNVTPDVTPDDAPLQPVRDEAPQKLPFLPKRKKFLIPIIILLSLTLIGSVGGLLIGFYSIKSSKAFEITMDELENHPQVRQHVGLPMDAGWIVMGKHDKNNGTYELTFTIEGPVGKAAVRSYCQRESEDAPWKVTYLDIGVGGREGTIHTLVGDPDNPPGGVIDD